MSGFFFGAVQRRAFASAAGAALLGVLDSGFFAGPSQAAVNQHLGALLVDISSIEGVDITGALPSDAALAAAFSNSDYVVIPGGCTISLDKTWEPRVGQVLWIGPNACIKRRSAAASTGPVVWMHHRDAAILGAGESSRIYTEKACPSGVIKIGATDMKTPIGNDVLGCQIKNLHIHGASGNDASFSYGQGFGKPDIAILINAPQIDHLGDTVVGNQACYFGVFADLKISKVNYGISHRGFANGFRGTNLHFERLGSSTLRGRAFDFNGGGENCYVNCWHHFAPYSDGVYARPITANAITYMPIGNQILSFMCEPGSSARMIDIHGEGFTITGLNYCGTTTPSYTGSHNIAVVNPSHLAGMDINTEIGTHRQILTDPNALGLYIQMAVGQKAAPLILRSSAGTTLTKFDADGSLHAVNLRATSPATAADVGMISLGNGTATTVGAAGDASALPAQPAGYLVAYVGATQVKIPYYQA